MGADEQDRTTTARRAPGNWRWVGVSALFVALALTAWIGVYTVPYRRAAQSGAEEGLESRRPHVVIFLIDTLRADRLGTYGYDKPTSPRMDELAGQSVVFDACYAPAPWTLPSVVSLMTSQYLCEHGVVVDGQQVLHSTTTLAERMKRAGYATASFYANPYAGPMTGLDRGFDHCAFHRATDGAVLDAWLETVGDEPVFVYIHNVEPHDPHAAPPRLVEQFGSVPPGLMEAVGKQLLRYRRLTRVDFAAGRPIGTTDNTAVQATAMRLIAEYREQIEIMYAAAVRAADERVGSVIDLLKARGMWADTLFIVTADHGEELYDHGGWQHDQSVYEELVRVPLIIRVPGDTVAPHRVDRVVSLVDLVPTLADRLGFGASGAWRGGSLVPLLQSAAPGAGPATVIPSMRVNRKKYYRPYKETRGDTNIVLRHGAWKGIDNFEIDTFELYDLATDPRELRDVAADHPELVQRLREHSRAWLQACVAAGSGDSGASPEGMSDAVRERLRSLGYVD